MCVYACVLGCMSFLVYSPNSHVYYRVIQHQSNVPWCVCLLINWSLSLNKINSLFIFWGKMKVGQSKILYCRSNKLQMCGRLRKRNQWPVLTYQIHRNYLFILEPNCFYSCGKFFYKLVFNLPFLVYSILRPLLIGLKI